MLKTKRHLILASASPRRKELLGWSHLSFEIIVSAIEENSDFELPSDIVMDLAKQKASAVYKGLDEVKKNQSLVVGADTIVVFEEQILEKPKTVDEARLMLLKLSGQQHCVYTGVALLLEKREHCFHVKTDVCFDHIDEKLLEKYLETGESMDKAGAYGIQGAALAFIGDIKGSYSNVVGLPINHVLRELKGFLGEEYEGLIDVFNK